MWTGSPNSIQTDFAQHYRPIRRFLVTTAQQLAESSLRVSANTMIDKFRRTCFINSGSQALT